MLDAFGKIVIQVDDNDYQGDSRLLYDENGKIGLLIFGWGSCSGCDALQACNSLEEVQELCDSLQSDIKWFDDKKQALEYFKNHDWCGDYSWHQTETKEFINKCIDYLSAFISNEKAKKGIKITRCTGEGQGICKRCFDNGKWNRMWMGFLCKIEGYEGCYCGNCVKELQDQLNEKGK